MHALFMFTTTPEYAGLNDRVHSVQGECAVRCMGWDGGWAIICVIRVDVICAGVTDMVEHGGEQSCRATGHHG